MSIDLGRGCKVIEVCDGITTPLDMKGHVIFENDYISKKNTKLLPHEKNSA